jgi:hypothetical protein
LDEIIKIVTKSVDQVVGDFRKACEQARREHRDPAKARAFLIRAGIIEKHKGSPNGVRLVKELR